MPSCGISVRRPRQLARMKKKD
ncbi:UNVERIFIED_CONTAM: hypothetical protein GTU68_066275 [Idotea baltica]|nr:hypothetical protein [Idotea baltica]